MHGAREGRRAAGDVDSFPYHQGGGTDDHFPLSGTDPFHYARMEVRGPRVMSITRILLRSILPTNNTGNSHSALLGTTIAEG